jgi:hypothetical protein
VIIEQAKGIAQRGNLSMHITLHRLRRYVRNHNALLNEVAPPIVETDLATDALDAPASAKPKQLSCGNSATVTPRAAVWYLRRCIMIK